MCLMFNPSGLELSSKSKASLGRLKALILALGHRKQLCGQVPFNRMQHVTGCWTFTLFSFSLLEMRMTYTCPSSPYSIHLFFQFLTYGNMESSNLNPPDLPSWKDLKVTFPCIPHSHTFQFQHVETSWIMTLFRIVLVAAIDMNYVIMSINCWWIYPIVPVFFHQ